MTDKVQKKHTLKAIAAICVVTFFAQDLAMAAPGLAAAMPAALPMPHVAFKLPESVGVIEDHWKASAPDAKLVVLIQDAHTNPSGQMNLARALEQILPAESIQTVYTEGAQGDVSLRFLRDRVAPQTLKSVTLEYLKKGIVKGDDYWNAVSDRSFRLWGVEDPELYRRSLEAYQTVVKLRPAVRPYLDRILRSAVLLEDAIYSPEIFRLEALRRSNKSGELNAAEYAARLLGSAKSAGVDLQPYPQTRALEKLNELEARLDLKALTDEQNAALKSLPVADQEELAPALAEVQKNPIDADHARVFALQLEEKLGRSAAAYPTLKKYFGYLHRIRGFNPLEMLKEIDALQEALVRAASPDANAIILRQTVIGVERLMDLVDLKVSSEEFERLQARGAFADLRPLTGWINARLAEDGRHPELAAFLDRRAFAAIRSAKEFYSLTRDRDQKMLQNLLDQMGANNESRAVLVTGGFHAQGLKTRLKGSGISFVSIIPQVLYETDNARYEKLLLAQLGPDRTLESSTRIASAPSSASTTEGRQKTVSSARLGAPLLGPEGARLAAALGDLALAVRAKELNQAPFERNEAAARMADAPTSGASRHVRLPEDIYVQGDVVIAEDANYGKVMNPGILNDADRRRLADALKTIQKINIFSENGDEWLDAVDRGGVLLLVHEGEITAAMRISEWENGAVAQVDYLISAYDGVKGKGSYLFKTALSEMRKRGVKTVYWTHDGESNPGFYQRRLAELVGSGVVQSFSTAEIGAAASITGFKATISPAPASVVDNRLYRPYSTDPFYLEIEKKLGARMAGEDRLREFILSEAGSGKRDRVEKIPDATLTALMALGSPMAGDIKRALPRDLGLNAAARTRIADEIPRIRASVTEQPVDPGSTRRRFLTRAGLAAGALVLLEAGRRMMSSKSEPSATARSTQRQPGRPELVFNESRIRGFIGQIIQKIETSPGDPQNKTVAVLRSFQKRLSFIVDAAGATPIMISTPKDDQGDIRIDPATGLAEANLMFDRATWKALFEAADRATGRDRELINALMTSLIIKEAGGVEDLSEHPYIWRSVEAVRVLINEEIDRIRKLRGTSPRLLEDFSGRFANLIKTNTAILSVGEGWGYLKSAKMLSVSGITADELSALAERSTNPAVANTAMNGALWLRYIGQDFSDGLRRAALMHMAGVLQMPAEELKTTSASMALQYLSFKSAFRVEAAEGRFQVGPDLKVNFPMEMLPALGPDFMPYLRSSEYTHPRPEDIEKRFGKPSGARMAAESVVIDASAQVFDEHPETVIAHLVDQIRKKRWFMDKESEILSIQAEDGYEIRPFGADGAMVGSVLARMSLERSGGGQVTKRYWVPMIYSREPLKDLGAEDQVRLNFADGVRYFAFADQSTDYQSGLVRLYGSNSEVRTRNGGKVTFRSLDPVLTGLSADGVTARPLGVSSSNVLTRITSDKGSDLVSKTYKDTRGSAGITDQVWPANEEVPRYEALAAARYTNMPRVYGVSYYEGRGGHRAAVGMILEAIDSEDSVGGVYWQALSGLVGDLGGQAKLLPAGGVDNATATAIYARQVGKTVAGMHAGFLNSGKKGFDPRPATSSDTRDWSKKILFHLSDAMAALKARASQLPADGPLNDLIARLERVAPHLARSSIDSDTADGDLVRTINELRVMQGTLMKGPWHGDLFNDQGMIRTSSAAESTSAALVQAILSGDERSVTRASSEVASRIRWLDFEGAPAKDTVRADAESAYSPLADVGSIVEGFWYIANLQLYTHLGLDPREGSAADREAARKVSLVLAGQIDPDRSGIPGLSRNKIDTMNRWVEQVSRAFIDGYLDQIEAAGRQNDILGPWDRKTAAALVDYFILERAIHELHYETYARDWGWDGIPGARVLQLAERIHLPAAPAAVSAASGARLALEQVANSDEPRFASPIEADVPIQGTFFPFHHMRSADDWGIGDFSTAKKAVDVSAGAHQNLLQILPITWSAANASPYSVASSRAIDPEYIGVPAFLDWAESHGIAAPATRAKIEAVRDRIDALRSGDRIDHAAISALKIDVLKTLWEEFKAASGSEANRAFEVFVDGNRDWLPDHMLYMALKRQSVATNPKTGWDWRTWDALDAGLTERDPAAVARAMERHRDSIAFDEFVQFAADLQFTDLARYGRQQGVELMTDIPAAPADADVWVQPEIVGLSRENGYRRAELLGVPGKKEAPVGQNWQFPVYDWNNPATWDYFLDLFRYNQKRSAYIRLDHTLALYRAYVFRQDTDETLTFEKLGIFDEVRAIRERAISEGTDAAKTRAVREAYALITRRLREKLPTDVAALLMGPAGTDTVDANMIMVARKVTPQTSGKKLPSDGPWRRWSQVEDSIFKGQADWDYIRLSHNDRADDGGFVRDYLFPSDESDAPKGDDSIRLAYYRLTPGEAVVSELKRIAQDEGSVVVLETLGTVPQQVRDSVERLDTFNYVPVIWGLDYGSWYHPLHSVRNAFSTFGVADSGSIANAWNDLRQDQKYALLERFLWDKTPEQRAAYTGALTPEVHEKLLQMAYAPRGVYPELPIDRSPVIGVLGWNDLLGLDDEHRLNYPGKSEQWVRRLPEDFTLEALLAAQRGGPANVRVRNVVDLLGRLTRLRQENSVQETKTSEQPRVLRTTPDARRPVLQIRRLDAVDGGRTEPFVVSAAVQEGREPGRGRWVAVLKDASGREEAFEMAPLKTLASVADGVTIHEARIRPTAVGVYEARVELRNADGAVAVSAPAGKLVAAAPDADLNPMSRDYLLRARPDHPATSGARMATDLELVGKKANEKIIITEEALKRIRTFMGIDDLVADQRLGDDPDGAMDRAQRAVSRILLETSEKGLDLMTMTQEQFNELFGIMPMMLSAGLTTRFSAYIPKHLAQGGMNRTVIGHALDGTYCSPGIAPVVFIGLKHLGLVVKDEYLRGYDSERHYFIVDPAITAFVDENRAVRIDPKYFDPEKMARYFGRSDSVMMAFIKPMGHGDAIQQAVSAVAPDTKYPYLQVAFGEAATSVLKTNSNASFISYLEIVATNAEAVAGARKLKAEEKVTVKGNYFFNGDPSQMMAYTDFEQVPHMTPTGKYDYTAIQKGPDLEDARTALKGLPDAPEARAERIREIRARFPYFAISDDGVLFEQETLVAVVEDVRRWEELPAARKDWIRRHFAVHVNDDRGDAEFLISANTATYRIESLRRLAGEIEDLRKTGGFDREGSTDVRINLFWSVEPKDGGAKTLAWNYVRLIADHALENGRPINAALAYVGEHAPSSIKDPAALKKFVHDATASNRAGLVETPRLTAEEMEIFEDVRANLVRGQKALAKLRLYGYVSEVVRYDQFRNVIRALFAASSSELWQSTLLDAMDDISKNVSDGATEPGRGPSAHAPPSDQIIYGIIENLTAEAVDAGWIGNNAYALISNADYAAAIARLRNRYAAELQRLRKKDLTIMSKSSRAEYLLDRLSENIVGGLKDLSIDLGALLPFVDRFEPDGQPHVRVTAAVGSVDDGGHSEELKINLERMGHGITPAPGDPSNAAVGFMSADKKAHLMGEGGRLETGGTFSRAIEAPVVRTITDPEVEINPSIFLFMRMLLSAMSVVDRMNDESYALTGGEQTAPHLDPRNASIRNILNISMQRYAGLLSATSSQNKGKPAIRTDLDMRRFQRAMIAMAEAAGVKGFESTVSSFNPATLYAVYSGWTLLLRAPVSGDGKKPLLPIAIELLDNGRISVMNPAVPAGRVELAPREETELSRMGAEVQNIRIGNDRGAVYLVVDGRRWTTDMRDLNNIVMMDETGQVKQLAYDASGRERQSQGNGNETPILETSDGAGIFLVPPVIKRQTFITEFQNHNKLLRVGLLEGYGLNGRIPAKKILQPPNNILLKQIRSAGRGDVIVVGPGSHWTSIAPHFLVEGFADALAEAKANGAEVVLMVNGVYDNETNRYDDPVELLGTIEATADTPLDAMFSRVAVSANEPDERLAERSGISMEQFRDVIHTPGQTQMRTDVTGASDAAKKGRALIYFTEAQAQAAHDRWPGLAAVVRVPESLLVLKTQKRKAGEVVFRVIHSVDAVHQNAILPLTQGVRPRQIIAVTGGSAMSTLWARISEKLMELPAAEITPPGARMSAVQSHDVRGPLMEKIDAALGKGRFRVYPGGFASIDITPLGVDKRTALTDLMQGKTHAVYFGDEFFKTEKKTGNDTPILTAKTEMADKNITVFSVDLDPEQRTEDAKANTIWIGKGPEATRRVLAEALDAVRAGRKELAVSGQGPDAHKSVTLDLDALIRAGAMVFDVDGTVLESKKENFGNQPDVRGLFEGLLGAEMTMTIISGNSRSEQKKRVSDELRSAAGIHNLKMYVNGGATRMDFDRSGVESVNNLSGDLSADDIRRVAAVVAEAAEENFGLSAEELAAWQEWFAFDGTYATRPDFAGVAFKPFWAISGFMPDVVTSDEMAQEHEGTRTVSVPFVEGRDNVQLSIKLFPKAVDLKVAGARMAAATTALPATRRQRAPRTDDDVVAAGGSRSDLPAAEPSTAVSSAPSQAEPSEPTDFALNRLTDWFSANYGEPPVIETVFDDSHKRFWATSLEYEGHQLLIRMDDMYWPDTKEEGPAVYHIFVDRDTEGYQARMELRLDADGRVDAEATLKAFFILQNRKDKYPWVEPLVKRWVRSMNGLTLTQDNPSFNRHPMVAVAFGQDRPGFPIYKPTTYGTTGDGVRQIGSPIADPAALQAPIISSGRKRLVFYGGLGAVVPRFYMEYLKKLALEYDVVFEAVDLLPDDAARQRIEAMGLPYVAYHRASEYKIDPKDPPAGIVVLTRPDSHFDLTQWANAHGVPVFVEKPITLPETVGKMRDHFRDHPDEMFAIDFFFDNPSAKEALKLIDEGRIGRIQSIEGEMIEENAIEKGREWLVTPHISGGGLGMDMLVHLTALAEMILERWNMSLRHAELDPKKILLARYDGAPAGTESYARIEGEVEREVGIKFGAGKGLNKSAYYLIVKGDKGEIEINLGTEHEKGFMEFRPADGGQKIRIENHTSDIGYAGTTKKMVHSLHVPGEISRREREFRMEATSLSVWLMNNAQVMHGPRYQTIPLHQDPSAIESEDVGQATLWDREQDVLQDIGRLSRTVAEYFGEHQPRVRLQGEDALGPTQGNVVEATDYLMLLLGDKILVDLETVQRTHRVTGVIMSPMMSADVTELEGHIREAVTRAGWEWAGYRAADTGSGQGARMADLPDYRSEADRALYVSLAMRTHLGAMLEDLSMRRQAGTFTHANLIDESSAVTAGLKSGFVFYSTEQVENLLARLQEAGYGSSETREELLAAAHEAGLLRQPSIPAPPALLGGTALTKDAPLDTEGVTAARNEILVMIGERKYSPAAYRLMELWKKTDSAIIDENDIHTVIEHLSQGSGASGVTGKLTAAALHQRAVQMDAGQVRAVIRHENERGRTDVAAQLITGSIRAGVAGIAVEDFLPVLSAVTDKGLTHWFASVLDAYREAVVIQGKTSDLNTFATGLSDHLIQNKLSHLAVNPAALESYAAALSEGDAASLESRWGSLLDSLRSVNDQIDVTRRVSVVDFELRNKSWIFALELAVPGAMDSLAGMLRSQSKPNPGVLSRRAARMEAFLGEPGAYLELRRLLDARTDGGIKISVPEVLGLVNTASAYIALGQKDALTAHLRSLEATAPVSVWRATLDKGLVLFIAQMVGLAEAEITVQDIEGWDMRFVAHLENALKTVRGTTPDKEEFFKAFLRAAFRGRSMDFIEDVSQDEPEGRRVALFNQNIRELMQAAGIDPETWIHGSGKKLVSERTIAYDPPLGKQQAFTSRMIQRDPKRDLFFGDSVDCCIAMSSYQRPDQMAERLADEGQNVLEVVNGSGQTVAGAWLYLGEDGSLVIHGFEMESSYFERTELADAIALGMLEHALEIAGQLGSPALYISKKRHDKFFPDETLGHNTFEDRHRQRLGTLMIAPGKIGGMLHPDHLLDTPGRPAYLVWKREVPAVEAGARLASGANSGFSAELVSLAGSALRAQGIDRGKMAYREDGARLAIYDLHLRDGGLSVGLGTRRNLTVFAPRAVSADRGSAPFDPSQIIRSKQDADAAADRLAAGVGAGPTAATLPMSVRVPVSRIFGEELTAAELRTAAQYLVDELLNIGATVPYADKTSFYFDPVDIESLTRGAGARDREQARAMKDAALIFRDAALKHSDRFAIDQPPAKDLVVNWLAEPLEAGQLRAGEFYVQIGRITRGVLPSLRMGLAVPTASIDRTVGVNRWKEFFDLRNAESIGGLLTVFDGFGNAGQLLPALQGRAPYQRNQFLRPLTVNAGTHLIEILRLTLTATARSA